MMHLKTNLSHLPRKCLVVAGLAAFIASINCAHATLVLDWSSSTYNPSSGFWLDSIGFVTATPIGSPTLVAGAFSGGEPGISLNGSNQYFTVNTGLEPQNLDTFTIAAVFKARVNGSTGANWYQGTGVVGMEQPGIVNDFGLGWNGNKVEGGIGIGGGSDQTLLSSSTFALNSTIAEAMTVNASTGTVTLYANGSLVGQISGLTIAARNSGGYGLGAITVNGDNKLNGFLGEIQIYDSVEDGRALTSSLLTAYTVPEPGSAILVLTGLAALSRRYRRP